MCPVAVFFSIFQLVRFQNGACDTTETGVEGTCFTPSECTAKGGTASGTCASSFGMCCTCKYFLDIKKLPLASTYVEFSCGKDVWSYN